MKKVLSILLALAMVAALIPAVFATDPQSGTIEIEAYYVDTTWTAPATGTVKMEINISGTAVEIYKGYDLITTFTDSGTFDVVAGTEYYISPAMCSSDSVVTWTYVSGTLEIEAYYVDTTWTAPATGTVKMEINISGTTVEIYKGYDLITTFTDSGTFNVVAGTEYYISPAMCSSDSVVTWTYVEDGSGEEGGEGGSGESTPVVLSLGDNTDLNLGEYTYTAEDDGLLTVSVTAISALEGGTWNDKDINMMGRFFSLYVNDDSNFTFIYQMDVTAGQKITVEFDSMFFYPEEIKATINLSMGGIDNPAPLALNSELSAVGTYYFYWTATGNGSLTVSVTGSSWYCLLANLTADVTEDSTSADCKVDVSAGDLVNVIIVSTDPVTFVATFEEDESGSEIEPAPMSGTDVSLNSASDPSNGMLYVFVDVNEPGTIGITISGNPGFWFNIYKPGYPDNGSIATPLSGTSEFTESYDVTEVGQYVVEIKCYANWADANGTVSYNITFTPGDVESDKPAYIIKDDVITQPGTYDITMEYADVTIVTFTPDATGIYQITALSNGVIGNYGGSSAYIFPSESVEHGATLEWTCQQVGYWTTTDIQDENFEWITIDQYIPGQSLMLGIKPNSEDVTSVQIVIEKIGDYTPVEVPTVIYENKADLKDFTVPEGATLGDYVNVYDEQTHTAVPGADGYFHLDSADGPILLVDLDYLYHLADALGEGRGTMFVNGTDENGNPVRFDIGAACKAYDYVSDENGYYPLTIDLMFFYKDYGAAQGVYSWALNEDPQNPGYNPDSAWMFACLTMTLPEDESSKTGESFPMGAIIAALALSAAACAAVVTNKKRFF